MTLTDNGCLMTVDECTLSLTVAFNLSPKKSHSNCDMVDHMKPMPMATVNTSTSALQQPQSDTASAGRHRAGCAVL